MHLWIDIDNPKHVPFFKALITELKMRGHGVIVTAENSGGVKEAIKEHNIDAKVIGKVFSVFGILKEPTTLIRTVLICDYLKSRNITAAFSIGSNILIYACSNINIPLILFLGTFKHMPNKLHFGLEKCFFLVSENIPEQNLIDKGFDIKTIAKFKGNIELEDRNPDIKAINDLVSKIEFLSKHIPGGISA